MANITDLDQLASSETNWSGSTLFAKAGYIRAFAGPRLASISNCTRPITDHANLVQQKLTLGIAAVGLLAFEHVLTHFSLDTRKRVNVEQCRQRSGAAECGIWSVFPMFANRFSHLSLGISKSYSLTHLKLKFDSSKPVLEIAAALNEFGNWWCKRECVEHVALKDWKLSILRIQSTLIISNSKGLSEILRYIRTSTYQICRIKERIIRTTIFELLNLDIYWKYCGKEEKLLLRSNFSSFFHNIFLPVVRFSYLGRDQIFTSRYAVIRDKRGRDNESQL